MKFNQYLFATLLCPKSLHDRSATWYEYHFNTDVCQVKLQEIQYFITFARISAQGMATESRASKRQLKPVAVRRPKKPNQHAAETPFAGAPCSEQPDLP
ncbi:MAG: hypothetical protein ACOVQQ_02735 [Flavobacterium sp.]